MQMISFVSFKGGAGKTTALMAIASALVERGRKVLLLEADENEPLALWQRAGEEMGTWSDRCRIGSAESLDSAQAAVEQAEADGFEFALADTAGGGSELNMMLIVNSDLVIVPSALTVLDIDGAITTMRFVTGNASRSVGRKIPTRLLLSQFPQSRLKTGEQENLTAIAALPQFATRLTERAAFADLRGTGLFGQYYDLLSASPGKRLLANHLMVAIGEARDVTDEMLAILEGGTN